MGEVAMIHECQIEYIMQMNEELGLPWIYEEVVSMLTFEEYMEVKDSLEQSVQMQRRIDRMQKEINEIKEFSLDNNIK